MSANDTFPNPVKGDVVAILVNRGSTRRGIVDRATATQVILTDGARYTRNRGVGVGSTCTNARPWTKEDDDFIARTRLAQQLDEAMKQVKVRLESVACEQFMTHRWLRPEDVDAATLLLARLREAAQVSADGGFIHTASLVVEGRAMEFRWYLNTRGEVLADQRCNPADQWTMVTSPEQVKVLRDATPKFDPRAALPRSPDKMVG